MAFSLPEVSMQKKPLSIHGSFFTWESKKEAVIAGGLFFFVSAEGLFVFYFLKIHIGHFIIT